MRIMARFDLRVDLLHSPADVAVLAATAAQLACDVEIAMGQDESGAPQWSARMTQDTPDALNGQLARFVMLRALLDRSTPDAVLTRLRQDVAAYGVPLDAPVVVDLSSSSVPASAAAQAAHAEPAAPAGRRGEPVRARQR